MEAFGAYSVDELLGLTLKIISVGILLQCVELINVRRIFSDSGAWRWELLKPEWQVFPQWFQKGVEPLLCYRGFLLLILLRALLALAGLCLPLHDLPAAVSLGLLLSTVLIALRWRGVSNGGSDYMTVVVLVGVSMHSVFGSSVSGGNTSASEIGLCYIGVQSLLSYLLAGAAKLRRSGWRRGESLPIYLARAAYLHTRRLGVWLMKAPFGVRVGASWMVMLFECLFPVVLLVPSATPLILAAGAGFHLLNAYLFGLSRFVFAWVATYPALIFVTQLLHR